MAVEKSQQFWMRSSSKVLGHPSSVLSPAPSSEPYESPKTSLKDVEKSTLFLERIRPSILICLPGIPLMFGTGTMKRKRTFPHLLSKL
jgi:hypothetical protein